MAPKVHKLKVKKSVLKRPAAGKAPSSAPSAIKGLAGFRKASAIFTGAVDKGVSQQNAALASRANVIAGLDVRLVCIEPAANSDKYYILQGLEDTKIPDSRPKRCYIYQRWGRTGTGGVCRLQGPMEEAKVVAHLSKVFKEKTGAAWGTLKPGEKAKAGMYWLAVASEADPNAVWEYFVDDGIDGKRSGWHPYDGDAIHNVEELFAEHTANRSGKNATSKRYVSSGKFAYCIDLDKLCQRNTVTGKQRKIRRTMSSASTQCTVRTRHDRPGSSSKDTCAGFFRADSAETLPVSRSAAELNARNAHAKAGRLATTSIASRASSFPGIPKRKAPSPPTSLRDMQQLADRGEVKRLSAPAIKSWLSSRSVATSGQKPDLVERVYSILEDPLDLD